MTTAPVDEPASRRLFICYRREDSGPYAGWLRESLVPTFGRERIFMDIDSIAPGAEFESVIRTTLAETDVVLVLIGPQWLSARDATGARRIDLHNDVLRREIAMAIECKRTMIPVLVGGARLPDSEMLPPEVQDLLRHQAVELTDSAGHTTQPDWSKPSRRYHARNQTAPAEKMSRPLVSPRSGMCKLVCGALLLPAAFGLLLPLSP